MSQRNILKKIKTARGSTAITNVDSGNNLRNPLYAISLLAVGWGTDELLFNVLKFMDFNTLFSFLKAVSIAKKKKRAMYNPESIDNQLRNLSAARAIWYSHISELSKIDERIKLGDSKTTEYAEYAVRSALSIFKKQCSEIKYLTHKHPDAPIWQSFDVKQIDESCTIQRMKHFHEFLESVNTELILSRIDRDSTELNLDSLGITRIPPALIDKEDLATYWQTLWVLRCKDNHLAQLPSNLYKLQSLNELHCNQNSIQYLPDSITKMRELTNITVEDNCLTKLPENIGLLTNLAKISVFNNAITHLPDSFRHLTGLRWIDFDNNDIEVLPSAMDNVQTLEVVSFCANKITHLPDWIAELPEDCLVIFGLNRITKISRSVLDSMDPDWIQGMWYTQCLPEKYPTLLHKLIKADLIKLLESVLEQGWCNIEKRDSKNRTPLMIAFFTNNIAAARILVKHGACTTRAANFISRNNEILTNKPNAEEWRSLLLGGLNSNEYKSFSV